MSIRVAEIVGLGDWIRDLGRSCLLKRILELGCEMKMLLEMCPSKILELGWEWG